MIDRSSRGEVRNPLVALPGFRRLAELDEPVREVIRDLLLELRRDARARAQLCWRKHKPPMAAYWAAVGVYAGHAARIVGDPRKGRGGGKVGRSADGPLGR